MKPGDKVTHIYNVKKCGVLVSLYSTADARVMWDGQTVPNLHPLSMIVPVESASEIRKPQDNIADLEEDDDVTGVDELNAEPVESDELIIDTDDDTSEPLGNYVEDESETVESEIIERQS